MAHIVFCCIDKTPPVAISCSRRDIAVQCSVVGPFLWPARQPGTRYQTIFENRIVLLTVSVAI